MSGRLTQQRLAILGTLLLCLSSIPAHAATITVTNTNDNGPGSLRQALTTANDGDTISFAVTGVITLTSGGLPINKNITISGPGPDQLSIDGNQSLLVLGIFADRTATISGLTVRNAHVGIVNQGTAVVMNCVLTGNSYDGFSNYGLASVNSCVLSGNSGGFANYEVATVNNCVLSGNSYDGVHSYEALTIVSNCVVSGNGAAGLFNTGHFGPSDSITGHGSMTISDSIISDNSGPGVWNYFFLTIVNSTVSGNSAGEALDGGGILSGTFKAPSHVEVINSTISGNSASGGGGGIAIYYWGLSVVNSTISGNSAGGTGGGIASSGGVQISNSTISGNSGGETGGGYAGGISADSVTVVNSTVADNSAATCGGICGETVEIGNTILSANASGNLDGNVTSDGYNISSDDGGGHLNGPGDQINTDPLLGPLQDNGGPTLTRLPLPGSPAIDRGDPNFTPPPSRDQRGPCFYRVFGRRVDVGSVETQPRPRCVTPAPRPIP